jgi:uncharacterized membrane protein
MELFIPSLSLLLVAVAVAFYVLPKFAPVILVSGSAVVLAIAIYFHLSKFGVAEYERATWYHNLRKYVAYVMIGAILLGAYGFYAMNNAGSSSPMPAITTPAMPAIGMPTVGGGFDSVMRTASSRIGELMRKGRISTD